MRSIDRHFAEQGLLDIIMDRVVALLVANDKLSQFTKGNIHATATLEAAEGWGPDYILVAVRSAEPKTSTSAKERQQVRVGIMVCHEEPNETLPPGSRTIATVEEEMKKALYADVFLQDAAGAHLTERLHKWEITDFDKQPVDSQIAMMHLFTLVYWLDQNVFTRKQFAP